MDFYSAQNYPRIALFYCVCLLRFAPEALQFLKGKEEDRKVEWRNKSPKMSQMFKFKPQKTQKQKVPQNVANVKTQTTKLKSLLTEIK